MKKNNKSLIFPFYNTLFSFVICLIVLTSAIFFGGNNTEYIAFFNIVICFSFIIISIKTNYDILKNYKILIIPSLLLISLLFVGYYRYTSYILFLSQNPHSSSIGITNFLINYGIYSPIKHFLNLSYWTCIFILSIISFLVCQRSGVKKSLLHFFFVTTVLIALYGIIIYFTGNKTILWLSKESYLNDLTATFINRNSYAIFAGSGFLAGLYYIQKSYYEFKQNHNISKFSIIRLIDYVSTYRVLYILSTLLIFVTIILSNSRAGISLTIIFSCLFYILTSHHKQISKRLSISRNVFKNVAKA